MNLKTIYQSNKKQIAIVLVLAILGIITRLLPHPANFAPVGAIALFSGFYFRGKWQFIMPIAIMLLSDSIIGFYNVGIMVAVYFCIAFNAILGSLVSKNKVVLTALPITIAGSVTFFLATNFAVWAFGSWYPHTGAGLANCYYLALPFFKNTLLGDLFYSFAFFGAYEFVAYNAKQKVKSFAVNIVR